MAWSRTAPELPSGSEWTQVGTTSWGNNNLDITSVVSVARLNGKGFAVQVVETRQHYRYNFTDLYLRCDIGGVTGTPETGIKGTSSNGSTTAYFTGEAAAGVTVDVVVGFQAGISSSLNPYLPATGKCLYRSSPCPSDLDFCNGVFPYAADLDLDLHGLPDAADLQKNRCAEQRGGGKGRGLNGDSGVNTADICGDRDALSGFTDKIERCRSF